MKTSLCLARRAAAATLLGVLSATVLPVHAGDGGAAAPADGPESRNATDADRVKRGFEIVPKGVHVFLGGRDRTLIGLGSYLVNAVGGCNDCHTRPAYAPGGNPFAGEPEMINAAQYLTGGRQFGPFTSANLRPDASGKPAGLNYAQFVRTLRTGHNPKDPPDEILQVMPWPVYGKMTDRDLRAVFEFLRALPSLPDNPNPGP